MLFDPTRLKSGVSLRYGACCLKTSLLVTQLRMVRVVRSDTTGVAGGLIAAGEQIDCPVLINRFRPLCLDHCCGYTGLRLYAAVLMDLTC